MHFLGANVKAATPPASALMSRHLEPVRTCQPPPPLSSTEAQGVLTISRVGELVLSLENLIFKHFFSSAFSSHPCLSSNLSNAQSCSPVFPKLYCITMLGQGLYYWKCIFVKVTNYCSFLFRLLYEIDHILGFNSIWNFQQLECSARLVNPSSEV